MEGVGVWCPSGTKYRARCRSRLPCTEGYHRGVSVTIPEDDAIVPRRSRRWVDKKLRVRGFDQPAAGLPSRISLGSASLVIAPIEPSICPWQEGLLGKRLFKLAPYEGDL